MTKRIAFTTLGCKVNQSETDLMARQFAAAGYACVPFDECADVYLVNTCTVTHVADKKSRQLLGQAHRTNPAALVVATGCYASIVGEALAEERRLIVRNRDKDRLLVLVEGRLSQSEPDVPSAVDVGKYLEMSGGQDRSRAMVKAQDGCDSHCTYCIIPRARGKSRSVPPQEIVRRVRALMREGHAEVVMTGVDLGSYGEDDAAYPDLGGLIQQVLEATDVPRIRISSVEPGDFNAAWLPLWVNPRVCRHLHVPLQSGSAGVLQRMERKYSPSQFSEMVEQCREAIPGVTITTDIMVGFPSETDEEFQESRLFIREIGFDGMHVFKYSKRSGTRAARMTDQVPEEIKAERSRVLREEAAAAVKRLLIRHVDVSAEIAWESRVDGIWRGLTDTNVRVYGTPEQVAPATLGRARLSAPFKDGLWAEQLNVDLPLIPIVTI